MMIAPVKFVAFCSFERSGQKGYLAVIQHFVVAIFTRR